MNLPPVKTAILSYGMSGEVFHAPLLSALSEFQLCCIVQRDAAKTQTHYPSVRVARSVDEVFKDDDIELIIVNTPNETHFDYTARALEAGKHVVVEKPFTVTSREADELIALSGKAKRILTVFQNRRWDSDYLTVKKIVREGELGHIAEFEAHYDRFRNYVEANTWKEEERPGTGILYNLGSHMLDQVVDLFGLPQYVDARIGVQRPGGKVDDFYDIRMEYASHLVIVKSSYLVKEPMPRYIVHGVNGSFVKYGLDPQEQALKEKRPMGESWGVESEEFWGKLNVLRDGISVEHRVPSEKGNYLEFYRNVFSAIRAGGDLAVKPLQVRSVISLIEKCYESHKNKCAVAVKS